MDAKTRFLALTLFLIILIALSAAIGIVIWNNLDYCRMESPFECFEAKAGNDGFVISIANVQNETISIEEVIISRINGQICSQPRQMGRDYDRIFANEAITYFISKDHSDGACLLEGLTGKKLEYEIELQYATNDTKKIAKGRGRSSSVNENVSQV